MAKKIFLSYRRDDSSGYTELLFSKLAGHYGQPAVFRDIHAIHPADRFREVIQASLSECAIVFVVMSKQWTNITDADGARRLEQPDDIVCWEIASALDHEGLKVLPILVGGATMPRAEELPASIRALASITAHEMSDRRWDYDFEELVRFINTTAPVSIPPTIDINPFSNRAAIWNDCSFHDRKTECRTVRGCLRVRGNCQLVGARRIGKSSVLRFVERHCAEWCPSVRVAYLDLQDPRCYTLTGWLKEVAHGFRLPTVPCTLTELMEAVEDLLFAGVHPVLFLDEFGEMAQRGHEFSKEVFHTLRACGQRPQGGMSILTAAPKRLSEMTDPSSDSSPFFNTFPVLTIRAFAPADARAYVDLERPGIPSFTSREKERILEFAQDHPLALQTACYHVLAARESGEDLPTSLARAREECRHVLI